MTINYPYADGDLLENRNTYFYSQYGGQDFLTGWQARRHKLAEDLQTITDISTKVMREETPFIVLSKNIKLALSEESFDDLNKLLQRWEVTKRIHSAYKENWRPVDNKDYKRADHYLIFAELLDLAYGKTRHLPYFNGLLKVMDTLTSLSGQFGSDERQRLLHLIGQERRYFDDLCDRLLPKETMKGARHAG